MRFLRMLTNSALAGAVGAAYLTVLVLHLNPEVPLASSTTLRWFLTLGIFYGGQIAALCYLLLLGREFFSMNILSPGWISVRVLAWLAAALAALAAALMWLNVGGFQTALGETATRRMAAGAAAITIAAVVLFGIAVAHYSFGRRGSRVGAALFAMAAFGSLALPLAARGPAPAFRPASRTSVVASGAPSDARVVLVLLDGASLDFIWPRAVEGRLPHFARLLETGATVDLATVRPTGPGPVWASAATGMYPHKNGVRSGAKYAAGNDSHSVDLLPDYCFSHMLVPIGLVRTVPHDSAVWRARPLWSILGEAGISVGVVRWPLTYPAHPVAGFMVSDRFHDLSGLTPEVDERAASPADALVTTREAFATSFESDPAVMPASSPPRTPAYPEDSALQHDRRYSRALHELLMRRPVQLTAIRYQGLDTVGHYYMGDAHPGAVSEMPEPERRRHLQVVDRYYAFVDGEVGAALNTLQPGDLLLVVSGFGIERQSPVKQIIDRVLGDPRMTGTHARAPDGFLLAHGTAVQPGRHQRGAIVDIAPTILYFLGLPVGRDMDGYARTDLFTRAFTNERPIAFVPTYNR